MNVRYALFDLGRVVLDWEPSRLYSKIFDDASERDWFLENVCTMAWHTRHDAGETFADTRPALIAEFPKYETEIRAWSERWMEMFFFSFSRRVGWVLHYITIVLGAVKKPLL